MALYPILSTKQRVARLREIVRTINTVIRGCHDVQRYYEKSTQIDFQRYEDIHNDVTDRMTELEDLLQQAEGELTRIRTQAGMVFQYKWEAGKCNLNHFNFDNGNSRIAGEHNLYNDGGGNVPTIFGDGSSGVLQQYDIVEVTNAEVSANNVEQPVDTGVDQEFIVLLNAPSADSEDFSAKVTLVAREV